MIQWDSILFAEHIINKYKNIFIYWLKKISNHCNYFWSTYFWALDDNLVLVAESAKFVSLILRANIVTTAPT